MFGARNKFCSEQETSFALSCSKLRSYGSKFNGVEESTCDLVCYCWETIRLHQRWKTSDHAFHGNAITINHAERAFPSCVETTRWRRFSKSLWRDVNQLCSSAKPQPFKYVWNISSASRRKFTTGTYETGLNGRRKLSKLQKKVLRNGSNFVSFIFAQALNRCRFIFAILRYFNHQEWDVKQTISKNILFSVESRSQRDLKSSMLGFEHLASKSSSSSRRHVALSIFFVPNQKPSVWWLKK